MKVHIMSGMNKLDIAKRAQILTMLCEGASMRSVSRRADVSINTVSKLLEDAGRLCVGFHRAVLVTADSDQVPLIRAIKTNFPEKRITLAAPPGRGNSARELGNVVHDRTPIAAGRLRGCFFPRSVLGPNGRLVATMPAIYRT